MKNILLNVVCYISVMLSALIVFAETDLVFDVMEPSAGQKVDEILEVQVSKAVFKRVGYNVKIRPVPWERAMREAKSGQVDGIIGVWYSEERSQFFEYTKPIYKHRVFFFKRKDQDINYTTLKDLQGYTIGVVRGWTYSEEFDQATFLQKDVVKDRRSNLLKLIHGRIDLTPDVEHDVHLRLHANFPEHADDIETVGKPLVVHLLYTIVSKANPNHKNIVEDFNRGLKMIKNDGTYNKILDAYKNKYSDK